MTTCARWIVAGWISLSAATAFTREVIVETRSGAVYEGQVRLRSNAVVVANVEKAVLTQVPFAHVRSLRMSPPSVEAPSSSEDRAAPSSLVSSAGASLLLPPLWQSADIGS